MSFILNKGNSSVVHGDGTRKAKLAKKVIKYNIGITVYTNMYPN